MCVDVGMAERVLERLAFFFLLRGLYVPCFTAAFTVHAPFVCVCVCVFVRDLSYHVIQRDYTASYHSYTYILLLYMYNKKHEY